MSFASFIENQPHLASGVHGGVGSSGVSGDRQISEHDSTVTHRQENEEI